MNDKRVVHGLSDPKRRRVIKTLSATAMSAGLGSLAGFSPPVLAAASRKVKIGFVTPLTGPLAPFGEADKFVLEGIKKVFKNGIMVGDRIHPVDVVVKNSESNSNKAGEAASSLILRDKVDLMLVASTVETINPVADQCELNGVPCISTVNPWQPWFFGRGAKPESGFEWTYHFFWGLEDAIGVFLDMWKSLPTNNAVGGLFPNDADGNAWGDAKFGLPSALAKEGFDLTDPGRYQVLNADFSAQIAAFKRAGCEIVTGNMIPPDVKTFWTQARQQGFKPKVASIAKGVLFPSAVEAMGDLAEGMSTELWWSPNHPFKSSLTGETAAEFAAAYENATKKQWTQPLGYSHALFEVAASVLKHTKDIDDREGVRDAIATTATETIVGRVEWGKGPVKNVAKTPLVGGQWVKGGKFKYDLVIVSNKAATHIPLGGKLALIA
ncbi:ABC transporter substrate-binding protein [Pollutimonas bauzanensis]|uniref:Branched-chain amino acid transport system substrate-binding protein n=1 Tax=Pollutimonas bauzanensis TaxID=658167 RepID=A0A1M5QGM6_9BURK|nr:ABC transporter substrate-binding protein [Pollutimonas bauzanensis]SHH12919.1 branched-chain amino acid transport system substrate-binding protein [Pollutimonas bauzanensis]